MSNLDAQRVGLRQINHLAQKQADNIQTGADAGTGLTIILLATTQLQQNPTVANAFNRAAQNWESIIKSPVTIYINVDYGTTNFGQAWDADVLGSTSTSSRSYPYQIVRANMIAEAVGEGNTTKQAIFNALPSTDVPTDVGAGNRVDVSDPVARAIGLLPATSQPNEPAASIAFNSNFNSEFDFDPSNGISFGRTDFDAVATHEIGHALGFSSDSGEGLTLLSIWDLYRFRTGTTDSTFPTAQRIMTIGGSPDSRQFDFIPGNAQLGLSTGGPNGSTNNGGDGWQSSHWRHTDLCSGSSYIGIMDPAISSDCRRTITSKDVLALGSFGYNLTNSVQPPPQPVLPAPTPPANDNFANAQVISGCSGSIAGSNEGATKETGEPSNPDSPTSTKSVWYQWQAPTSNRVTIDTKGSDFDTVLAIYTGNNLAGPLSLVAHSDDIVTGENLPSSVSFNATQGTIYRIVVNGFNNQGNGGDDGNVKLNWTESNCTQAPVVQFSQATYAVGEASGNIAVIVNRFDSTGTANIDYATSDTAGLAACSQANTGIASSRCDYATTMGTLRFAAGESSKIIFIPVVDDGYIEGSESFTVKLSNPTGASLGNLSTATVTISDNDGATSNPIAGAPFFVRQQYIDFLGREPDPAGFAGWLSILNNCAPGDTSCDRIAVSAGFFRSPEFQDRGSFIFRFYSAALGRNPAYAEFMPDLAKVSGFLSDAQLEANKVAFVNEFMTRSEFSNRYGSLSNTAFVDTLIQTAGMTSHPLRDAWIGLLNNGTATRAQVLRAFTESAEVYQKFYNQAFVVMQYFGYLRRDPDASYLQWIQTMNSNGGDYRAMINGFISSNEYVLRFGP